MKVEIKHYNGTIHSGKLPIRVLNQSVLDRFQSITPNFSKDAKDEIEYHDLSEGIKYDFSENKITNVSEISENTITLYENFNQYLWCICYSLLVITDEGIVKPMHNGSFNGTIDWSISIIKTAFSVYQNGLKLLKEYNKNIFSQLPNPEKYKDGKDENLYIEKANAIYVDAMTFILIHEFAHHYYRHCSYEPETNEQSIKEEIDADNYAIDTMLDCNNQCVSNSKIGIIAGLSALILLYKNLKSNTHPDTDDRINNAIQRMNLQDTDTLWDVTNLTFILWAKNYDVNLPLNTEYDSGKELYNDILFKLKNIKLHE
jgi:hypothetical protein